MERTSQENIDSLVFILKKLSEKDFNSMASRIKTNIRLKKSATIGQREMIEAFKYFK